MHKKKLNIQEIEITKSSGNVFEDLELPNSEEYLAKAKLAYQINKIIERIGLKQKEAATLLGIDQPKISALSRGRLSGFSVERLFKFLAILNQDIAIIITPHKKNHYQNSVPHIHVKSAKA